MNKVVEISFNFKCGTLECALKMKNITQILSSPNVTQKIESNPLFQLDNPITSKAQINTNPTKKILRKRISKVKCPVEILSNLQKASVEYHKIASKR